jgi:glycosyltransferase involved in cell wall biosynthesis
MNSDRIQTVWVLSTADISTAPGTTEAYYLVQKFAERWETHVFAPVSNEIESVYAHSLPVGSILAALLFNTILVPYFIWQAIRHPPDIVYSYRNIFVPVLVAELLTDATIVYDMQVDPYQQPKEFEQYDSRGYIYHLFLFFVRELHQFNLPRADGVVTLSEPLVDRLHTEYGVPREKIGLIPLAADPTKFTPASNDDEQFRIVYVGALRRFRGIDDLVLALANLDSELRSQVHLDLYGEADEEFIRHIEELASDGPSIKWHGYVTHDKLTQEVAECDVAASPLPPIDSFEMSSPAKIYEYLAMGLPIVATDITPHRTILSQECSILVPPDDTESMTNAFARILSDDEYRFQLSTGARQKALENTWTDRFDNLSEYLKDWS